MKKLNISKNLKTMIFVGGLSLSAPILTTGCYSTIKQPNIEYDSSSDQDFQAMENNDSLRKICHEGKLKFINDEGKILQYLILGNVDTLQSFAGYFSNNDGQLIFTNYLDKNSQINISSLFETNPKFVFGFTDFSDLCSYNFLECNGTIKKEQIDDIMSKVSGYIPMVGMYIRCNSSYSSEEDINLNYYNRHNFAKEKQPVNRIISETSIDSKQLIKK